MEYIRLLGSGGQARIYLVKAGAKYLACKESEKTEVLERESFFLSMAKNDSFVRFVDFQKKENRAYLLMEYICGQSLAERMREMSGLGYEEKMELLMKTAEGLAFLHSMKRPVIHRDIKPENIMLTEDGGVKIIDFGCACFADRFEGTFAGTKGYAPQEQFSGKERTKMQGLYSDVYAFGRLMHFVLTGDDPYLPPAVKPDIRRYDRTFDKNLAKLTESCVKEDAQNRPPDMRYVLHELKNISAKKKGFCGRFQKSRGIYQREFVYEKNILLR